MILSENSKITRYIFTNLYDITEKLKHDGFKYDQFLLSINNIEAFLIHCVNKNASIAILRGNMTCEFFKILRIYDSDIDRFGEYYELSYNDKTLPLIFSGNELDIHMFILSDNAKILFKEYSIEIYDKYSINRIK